MKQILFSLALAGLATSLPAHANEALAKKYNCLACHSIDRQVVGPAYKAVAKKYAGQKDIEAKLIAKVKNGGAGVWGPTPMPPNATVSAADLKTLVHWILSLK
jgi:cytochrome c